MKILKVFKGFGNHSVCYSTINEDESYNQIDCQAIEEFYDVGGILNVQITFGTEEDSKIRLVRIINPDILVYE
jgi:hypothetical protein